jgi:RNase P subunit RPR2
VVNARLPQRIICKRCGNNLYEGIELEAPLDVIQRYNGQCPNCGNKLEFNYENIRIIPK